MGGFSFVTYHPPATCRTEGRHAEWSFLSRSFTRDHLHHLRNHVAGPLYDDRIPDPDVFTVNLVLIVQGGTGYRDASDLDGLH